MIKNASEINYVILTAEQFATDYPSYNSNEAGIPAEGPVLVLHDDDNLPVAVIEGDNKAMLAELFGDISDYARAEADPGAVQPKVGHSSTVVAGK